MKVLYTGVYRDGTGYGHAAIDYILALDAAGVDVVCRPIKLNGAKPELPEKILELESKDSAGCDICIQHILPNFMDYNGRFKKNIGLFACETTDFSKSSWGERLNLMDEVWVINHDMVGACELSGVEKPVKVVPHACDISRYQKQYEPLPLPKQEGDFVFYFIGEFNRRKNLAALLKAFHCEFDPTEPVQLVLRTSPAVPNPKQQEEIVRNFIDEVKRGLKLYGDLKSYKAEIVVLNQLTENDLMRLHTAGDCFVSASYGEAWCIPAFDAMAMGKTPIITDCGGPRDYVYTGGFLIDSRYEPVFGMLDTFNDLYVATEDWCSVNIGELRAIMRRTFEDRNSARLQAVKESGQNQAYGYSHVNVGNMMKKLLEAC